MILPTTSFLIGFFLGGMAAGVLFFLALTVYYWRLAREAQEEIYGNDKENNNETETD